MTWFETLTGCVEKSPDHVRQHLRFDDRTLLSTRNGQSWRCGELELPSLGQLRELVRSIDTGLEPTTVREVVADVQQLHRDASNQNALFQVASQFNLLEMTSPRVTPEAGVGIYEQDFTQGPACAIAAGAGTIFRNYFATVNGRIGQSADNQIDCLSDIGTLLDNSGQRLWRMANGYSLPSADGLKEVHRKLTTSDPTSLDELRQALRVGVQWETQVTLGDASHNVSQVYCSALPVAYAGHPAEWWAPFATLILEAAYEATICAALLNRSRTGSRQLFLTLLGGGAFGNEPDWILNAMRRAINLHARYGLDVRIVSYRSSNRGVRQIAAEYD